MKRTERDHQDAVKKMAALYGAETAKALVPNETERQGILKRSAFYHMNRARPSETKPPDWKNIC